ncbi:MAG TPA: YhjD/YihY/BrkB family envelope integrity protein [Gaiellaceae bacterium]|nr:YhjD/YihY/BrkB family envelope integrity protein [Gaiellaceae bacterium]
MATHTQRGGKRRERTLGARLREAVDLWVDLFDRHGLLTYASAIALQTLVAAIALALLGLGVLGAIGREDLWNAQLAPQVQHHVLPSVFAGIQQTVQGIFARDSTGLIVFAAVLAIWEVSGAVRACMGALTRVYDAEETRPWWIRFPISFALAVAMIAGLLGAILLVMAVHGPHGVLFVLFDIFRWLLALLLVGLAFGLLVRFAPAERRAKRWASVGASLVVVAWVVQALVFKWYVGSVANLKTATGSLLVFLLLTSFFYVGSIVLLVGIELDELLRKDAKQAERTIHELARELF